jgi:hypothetical protein
MSCLIFQVSSIWVLSYFYFNCYFFINFFYYLLLLYFLIILFKLLGSQDFISTAFFFYIEKFYPTHGKAHVTNVVTTKKLWSETNLWPHIIGQIIYWTTSIDLNKQTMLTDKDWMIISKSMFWNKPSRLPNMVK